MKRAWSICLSLVLLLGITVCFGFSAKAADYQDTLVTASQLQTGDTFYLGAYPQSRVTDDSLLNALDGVACDMTSYGYMKNAKTSGHTYDTVRMLYADIAYNGERYRKVTFNEHRPFWTTSSATTANTNQDENGYTTHKSYYFKWEPIVWHVLANESDGVYVMSQTLLDCQAYNNFNEGITWQGCSLRGWLNNDFYNAAFSAYEKTKIKSTYHANEGNPYFDISGGGNTTDYLWVLSYSDAINSNYGFPADYAVLDISRQKQGSDYAKCQGLNVTASGTYAGNSMWWLRTPGVNTANACGVNSNGYAYNYYYVNATNRGIAPAFKLLPDAEIGNADDSALIAVREQIELLEADDYSEDSFNALMALSAQYADVAAGNNTQAEIDTATADLLNAVSALVPYLNLTVTAENGTYDITLEESTYEDLTSETFSGELFGEQISLTATPAEGYVFKGWYETVSHRVFSTDEAYTFTLTSNTSFKALMIPENAASIYFENESGYIKDIATKTCTEWSNLAESDVAALMPEVPYRYGSTDGHWVCADADYLGKLAQGEDVVFTAAYTDVNRPDDADLPPVNSNGVPNLTLTSSYDEESNVCTYIMGAGIDENCHIVSVGIAFYYGKPSVFDPATVFVTLNNKMTTSKFEVSAESNYYIVNVKKFNRYNWAAKGYVTYYDSYGVLRTAYSEQINIVNE